MKEPKLDDTSRLRTAPAVETVTGAVVALELVGVLVTVADEVSVREALLVNGDDSVGKTVVETDVELAVPSVAEALLPGVEELPCEDDEEDEEELLCVLCEEEVASEEEEKLACEEEELLCEEEEEELPCEDEVLLCDEVGLLSIEEVVPSEDVELLAAEEVVPSDDVERLCEKLVDDAVDDVVRDGVEDDDALEVSITALVVEAAAPPETVEATGVLVTSPAAEVPVGKTVTSCASQ
ncbi:hypothetical protein F5B20DRAFT_577314 [Whalleya microplaca]|nr:hypothetical protein F5B20DRAFT_577314 [Whalleya microplaca]